MLVTQLLFKEKVNHKSLRGVLGSGDLYCTSYEELQPTKMTAPGGPVQPEGTGTFCAWQQQRSRSSAATQLSGSYSTLSWTQLGWAVPPVPPGAGGTLNPAQGPCLDLAQRLQKPQMLHRDPPRSQHTLLGDSQPTDLILLPSRALPAAEVTQLFIESLV